MTTPPGGEDEDPRTVFIPPTARPPEDDNERTVFEPGAALHPKSIKVGDVLNHMFAVRRFIARGGMGEVFEGANVITDERVAIKVMLPALASDPNVITLFRREARTLTRLHHQAVVQYRVLAQEPELGVLYIVTEYIDGTNLSDMLGTLAPTPEALGALLRRLASGLAAAHALGAIHRDISPDNVLLGGGELAQARIIDFGIAKDLDPGTATIVGDGFAGKLGYVAPEQLGDYGRELGPWTDVYSLGLLILAVARGRDLGLGGSLVDAVDKRRAGLDLSAVPATLRPIIDRMTRPKPSERYQSMAAVLAALDQIEVPREAGPGIPRNWKIGAGVAAALMLALIGWLVLGGYGADRTGPGRIGPASTADPITRAGNAINAALPSVSCTWLRVVSLTNAADGAHVALTGVAGSPAAALTEINRALKTQDISGADIDFSQVAPINQSGCAALDAYRQIRAPSGNRLSVPQRKFEMRTQPPESAYPGSIAANAVIGISVADPSRDLALVGLEPSGKIDMLVPSRAAFVEQLKASKKGLPVTDLGGDRYRLQIDLDHAGWSGLLLISGKGPFDPAVVAPPLGARGADWRDRLVAIAAEHGWEADMIWFRSVDEVKD
ncbi:serine/threonine-protein kinase [Sphingomonas sp.]|uniref:serine/threonine-protein kinase n=1 Tax=Sphingomonas sp. TaxID=28214 RepID=UPI003D6C74C7